MSVRPHWLPMGHPDHVRTKTNTRRTCQMKWGHYVASRQHMAQATLADSKDQPRNDRQFQTEKLLSGYCLRLRRATALGSIHARQHVAAVHGAFGFRTLLLLAHLAELPRQAQRAAEERHRPGGRPKCA